MNHLPCRTPLASAPAQAAGRPRISPDRGIDARENGLARLAFTWLASLVLELATLALLLPAGAAFAADGSGPATDPPLADGARPVSQARDEAPRKRFQLAAADLAAALAIPWALDRYVGGEEYSRISWRTVGKNVRSGYCFDDDDMLMNQFAHPFHGSVYFNAGRTNGFSFWESSLFAALGSLTWEYAFENTAPSKNDMINTVIGGTIIGEASFRLSGVILDNTSRGTGRLLRELAAALVNPVSGVNRLVTGEAWKNAPNPPDRLPSRLAAVVDAGWAWNGHNEFAQQAVASLLVRYGDPHESPVKKPFDSFDLSLRAAVPNGTAVTEARIRGILGAWSLGERGKRAEHLLSVGMRYEYVTPNSESFAAEAFEGGLLSRFRLGNGLEVRTEAQAVFFPIAAIQTDCEKEARQAVGRTYDFSFGGGPRLDARLTRADVDLARVSWDMAWFGTANGVASSARVQRVRAEARWPITPALTPGAAWSWYSRSSRYDSMPSVTKTHGQLSVFLSWRFR